MTTFIFIMQGGVIMARQITCPFCDETFTIHPKMTADRAFAWLRDDHIPSHVDDLLPAPETCARCKRVPLSGATPHRPCYLADCLCSCSYPAPPADLTVRFEEAE